nr:reverse transcriptase domain-containing protein [Tanacetum cinerariifolium]
MNTASSLATGSLLSNTVPNPWEDLKAITTQSGVTLAGPSVFPPPPLFREVDRELETITDQVLTESTNYFPPLVVQVSPASTSSTSTLFSKMPEVTKNTSQLIVDYVVDPRVPLILEGPFLRTVRALIDVYGEELTLRVDDEAITFKLGRSTDPIIALSSPSLTPFEGGDFILEEIEACLTSKSIRLRIDDTDLELEGDIRLLEELLNKDPSSSPLPPKELSVEEVKTIKSSIGEPPELELKELPSHLEYVFLERTDKLADVSQQMI